MPTCVSPISVLPDASQGPDEVHIMQIGIQELKRAADLHARLAVIEETEAGLLKSSGASRAHL